MTQLPSSILLGVRSEARYQPNNKFTLQLATNTHITNHRDL